MFLLHHIVFWSAVAIFVPVQGVLLSEVIDFRRYAGRRTTQRNGSTSLEIVWAVVPAIVLIVLGLFAYQAL